MFSLCNPALIYVIFSLTQIIFDISNKMYNTAFMKFVVALLITFLLNGLCQQGLSAVSWIIVLIPFIFMSVIVGIMLYIFGMNETSGSAISTNESSDASNNIYIVNAAVPPSSFAYNSVLFYPASTTTTTQPTTTKTTNLTWPFYSSSPEYESFR